jgi:hypothetical protein
MTGRGDGRKLQTIPFRPVTPPAPDSLSVPEKKLFTAVRSVGSGAAADIKSQVRAVKDIEQSSSDDLRACGNDWYQDLLDEIETFAERVHHDEDLEPTNDPTWGFRVFVTSSYSPEARERLPRALANWMRAQEWALQQTIGQRDYQQEIIRRFKLDVVEDESLENASDDRVREEFRAWMKGLDFTPRGEEEEHATGLLSTVYNPSENICLVLDEARIAMLADLTFDELKDDLKRFESMTVRAIDGTWRRPAEVRTNETYRGVGDISIIGLAELFTVMASPEGGGHSFLGIMHDLHPLNGMPEWTGELS